MEPDFYILKQTERQRALNVVWDLLITKASPKSMSAAGFCKYRGQSGSRCSIGQMISDHVYESKLEGRLVGSVEIWEALRKSGWKTEHLPVIFLRDLQHAHDTTFTVEGRRKALLYVVKRYNLRIPNQE